MAHGFSAQDSSDQFLFITDLDHTLVGDDAAMTQLNEHLVRHRETHGTRIVYSTGRSRQSYQQLRTEKPLIEPDAVITGVGTAIYYGEASEPDPQWSAQLSEGWARDRILAALAPVSTLTPQPESEQNPFKISFFLAAEVAAEVLPQIEQTLHAEGHSVNLVYSGGRDLDILPIQANKGLAMTFLRETWQFPPERTVACGDSGNDRALFAASQERGIIVGNAMPELLEWHHANPSPHRYLADSHCAGGILEGLRHFQFI